MTNVVINQDPWVRIGPGDVSFQMHNDLIMTNRASIEIDGECPHSYAIIIAQALERGWIRPIAVVPRTDPTLMWDLLKTERKNEDKV